jgi:hypothetical protein
MTMAAVLRFTRRVENVRRETWTLPRGKVFELGRCEGRFLMLFDGRLTYEGGWIFVYFKNQGLLSEWAS